MAFPIKKCVACGEEFELKPGKPGFANRCPDCSETESGGSTGKDSIEALDRRSSSELNAERRKAMRDMLYRKDS
jgi:hypothetical protein